MYYVYVLESLKNKNLYIGFTNSLEKRLVEHNNGETKSTKPFRPWKIIFYEAYVNKYDALRREKYLKCNKGATTLKSMLKEYFSKSLDS